MEILLAARLRRSNRLERSVQLYHAYDGRRILFTAYHGGMPRLLAGSLGRFWIERQLAESTWQTTTSCSGDRRCGPLRGIAAECQLSTTRMERPARDRRNVLRGRGSWRAMRTPIGTARSAGHSIRSATDVIEHLGIMPIPGTPQYLVPLFNDMWVTQVPRNSLHWPLYG
jgi:hypothetical protein